MTARAFVQWSQKDLEKYLAVYNTKRPHQGRGMNGRIPLKAFMDGLKQKDRTGGQAARNAA